LEPGEIPLSSRVVVDLTHPEDRTRMIDAVERLRHTARPDGISYRIIRPDGEVRFLQATTAVVKCAPAVLFGSVRDVTDGRRAEREIEAHNVLGEALEGWTSLQAGPARLLRALAEAMDFQRAVFWIATNELLVPRFGWAKDGADVLAQVHEVRLGADVGLAGRAWNTRKPVMARDVMNDTAYALPKAALRDGLRGAVAIPAVAGDEALAVLGFVSRETLEPSDRLLRSLERIGREVGDFLVRRRAELYGSPLTTRQLEILQLAARGYSRLEIAARLKISPTTVRTHLEHIYARLGVSDRVTAVAKAIRDGLIQ
jgi:DNA-binding CsgD family transcriptional regulator